jgi:predicted DNA binding CopG/RHH family protein
MSQERFTVRVTEDLLEAAKEKAQREDLTLSQVIRHLLREWLAEDSPKDTGERIQRSE